MALKTKATQDSATQLCYRYLDILYQPYYAQAPKRANQAAVMAQSYGEILVPSVAELCQYAQLTPNDVFVDLGAGLGKLVIQVFLQTPVRKAIGVEIVPNLHAASISAREQVYIELPELFEQGRQLEFILGDFLLVPFLDATVLLLCAVCFPPTLLDSIGHLINTLPHVHTVFSLRPLPNLKRLQFVKTIRVECSWDTALCYVYRLR